MKNYGTSKFLNCALALLLIFALTACDRGDQKKKTPELKHGGSVKLTLSDTDYSNGNNWLSFGGEGTKNTDVFIVYPTITWSTDVADQPYINLENEAMRSAAANWLLEVEDIFTDSANVYAPFYRQLNGVEFEDMDAEALTDFIAGAPRDDVFAAFDHYLTKINKRPFILFGYAQGAQLVIELATTFLGNQKYYRHNKKFIAAYAVGFSVLESQIAKNPNLKFAENKSDTCALVSWNTTAPSEIATGAYKNFITWKQGALNTNPITWRTDETLAHAGDNPASKVIAYDDVSSETLEEYANAIVDKEHSVILVTTVDESRHHPVAEKVSRYHKQNIAFFHESIKQNIKDRIAALKAK